MRTHALLAGATMNVDVANWLTSWDKFRARVSDMTSEDTKGGQTSTTPPPGRSTPWSYTVSVFRAMNGTLVLFLNIITAIGVVVLVLQLGAVIRPLPDVVSKPGLDGYAELNSQGLPVQQKTRSSKVVPPGLIVGTTPSSTDGNYVMWNGNAVYFEDGRFHTLRGFTMYVSSGPPKAKPSDVMPNVYRLTPLQAQQQLAAAGFTNTVVWSVCSGSVPSGLVRQVVLANQYPEVEVVGTGGPTNEAKTVLPNQQLAIKVSTGPC